MVRFPRLAGSSASLVAGGIEGKPVYSGMMAGVFSEAASTPVKFSASPWTGPGINGGSLLNPSSLKKFGSSILNGRSEKSDCSISKL